MAVVKSVDMSKIAGKVRTYLHKVFSNIYYEGPALDPEQLGAYSIMPVCTHRSQVDYFVLGQFLNTIGVQNVRYAAGDNLTDLPFIGSRFRRFGAFPVSRGRASSRTYIRDLCEQVVGMVLKGDSVVVFPEGGRSYKGHMMDMKAGLIGALIVAQWRNPDDDFMFFPVAISYEKLPELMYFNMLQKGKQIRSVKGRFFSRIKGNAYYFGADILAFSKFMLAKKVKIRYGDVFVDYEDPVSVRSIVDLDALYNKRARDDFSGLVGAMQQAGKHIFDKFLQLYRILPSHILASILEKHSYCTRVSAAKRAEKIVGRLLKQNRNLKSIDSLDGEQIVDKAIAQLSAFRALSASKVKLRVRKPSVIKYYAASLNGHKEAHR
jgi:1-acyl-sn-glycerol-3-phosphate acyltransferase